MQAAACILKASMETRYSSFALVESTPSAIPLTDANASFASSGKHVDPY